MNGTNTGVCTCHQATTGPCAVHGPSWAWQNERYLPAAPQGTSWRQDVGYGLTLSNEPPVSSSPPVSQAGNTESSSSPEDSPEGRSSCSEDNEDEAATVNIPLAVQERLLALTWMDSLEQMSAMIDEALVQGVDGEVFKLALCRLRGGYADYGSTMYGWDAATRRRNVLEEIADAPVYLSSGPIE